MGPPSIGASIYTQSHLSEPPNLLDECAREPAPTALVPKLMIQVRQDGSRLTMVGCHALACAPGAVLIDGGATAALEGCLLAGSQEGPGLTVRGAGALAVVDECEMSGNAGPGVKVGRQRAGRGAEWGGEAQKV